jgi:NitT/TauT family transport system substrate-binding protein
MSQARGLAESQKLSRIAQNKTRNSHEETAMMRIAQLLALAMTVAAAGTPANAQETLKLTVGQRGLWDTSISDVGQRAGIFKKHGLNLEILYTQGSGETQQAVFAGSVDIGVSTGVMGALSGFAKGAPVRILGNEIMGAGDLYWYVKADSPVKTIKDFNGKSIAFSTVGASTHGVVSAFIKQYGLTTAKPTPTGSPAPTLTALMSGQVDVGWAAPPFGLDQLDRGEIRQIATGNDTVFKGQTVRLVITNTQTLKNRKDALVRYMRAYRETIDWMYSDPAALKTYAEFAGVTEARAKRIRDDYFPKSVLNPDQIVGIDLIMPEAVNLKFISAPLTKEQLAELIQIPPRN